MRSTSTLSTHRNPRPRRPCRIIACRVYRLYSTVHPPRLREEPLTLSGAARVTVAESTVAQSWGDCSGSTVSTILPLSRVQQRSKASSRALYVTGVNDGCGGGRSRVSVRCEIGRRHVVGHETGRPRRVGCSISNTECAGSRVG